MNPWFEVLQIFAAGFGITFVATVLVRLANGASPCVLWRTRFYELPPLRALIHLMHVMLWISAAIGVAIGVLQTREYFERSDDAHLIAAGMAVVAGIILGLCARRFRRWMVRIDDNRPPDVRLAGIELQQGIPAKRLAVLGAERFPNRFHRGWCLGLWVRGILATVCFLPIAITIYAFFDRQGATSWLEPLLQAFGAMTAGLVLPSKVYGLVAFYVCGVALLLSVLNNGQYLLFRFRQTLVLQSGLITGMVAGAVTLSPDPEFGAVVLAIGSATLAARWVRDLKVALSYPRFKTLYDRVAAEIQPGAVVFRSMAGRPDCRLNRVDEPLVGQRIRRGCRNVEAVSWLVTRNFARFMRLVTVHFDHFVVGSLRFLTVRRYVTESCQGGTNRGLQNPCVPAWDEQLFPLQPPRGFLDWLDSLFLGSQWDRVAICGTCYGRGLMTCSLCSGRGSLEQHCSCGGGKAYCGSCGGSGRRSERCTSCGGRGEVRCSTCGGAGRLVFSRSLNTQWQRFQPAVSQPEVPLPELLEDAEERVYYRLPFVEDRQPVDLPCETDGIGDDLIQALEALGQKLAARSDEHRRCVLDFHGAAYVYRADFQVTGFWTLCLRFRRLRGRFGWFFGKRPEFYFPRVPFSWSMAGTVLFLPPLVVIGGLWLADLCREMYLLYE